MAHLPTVSSATVQGREFSGAKMRARRLAIKDASAGKKGSQSWLAYMIGAHVTSISDWERGANAPSPRHLDALAQALGCEMDELFETEEVRTPSAQPFQGK